MPVALLHADRVRLEMGIECFASGTLTVASRTVMPGCNGAMLEWWFKYFEPTNTFAGGIQLITSAISVGTSFGKKVRTTSARRSGRRSR
ncbi:DAPG hydrolase family protein [Rhizobium sullae]|uniref:DAPG hydrolase family protein n=1 Tax=Rhizobium sullae TaxID=50338 RepID=UPI003CC81F00